MTETTQVVTMNVKEGQVSFSNLPNGIVVEINNYDTGIPAKTPVGPERILDENLYQDVNGEWYTSHAFSNTETLAEVNDDYEVSEQLELGV